MKKYIPKKHSAPFAYFITFVTYGNWLHFDKRGSVDCKHNTYGTPRIQGSKAGFKYRNSKLLYQPFVMNELQRKNVMQTIISVCEYCHWRLFAVNVRSNHIHIVAQSEISPEDMMTKFKAYASRNLNTLNPENKGRRYWARHGSTIHVRSKDYFNFLMDYVVIQQGSKIACHYEKWFDNFDSTFIIPDSANAISSAHAQPERLGNA